MSGKLQEKRGSTESREAVPELVVQLTANYMFRALAHDKSLVLV